MNRFEKLIFIIVVFLLFSCKEKTNQKLKRYNIIQSVYNQKDYTVKFNFPDTLYKDSIYLGAIFYENEIDSLNYKLNKDDRYLNFIYKISKENNPISDNELENNVELFDTLYGFSDKGKMVFANEFIFNELGENYINGVISDDVYLQAEEKEKVRWISKKYRTIHKVFVIDK